MINIIAINFTSEFTNFLLVQLFAYVHNLSELKANIVFIYQLHTNSRFVYCVAGDRLVFCCVTFVIQLIALIELPNK